MVVSIRPFAVALGLVLSAVALGAEEPDPGIGEALAPKAPPFVPKRPRTVEDRERIEALQQFAAARALEEQRRWSEALRLLEAAREKLPDSVAILRRLSRLSFALGRTEQGIAYSRQVIEADPNDTGTLRRLVAHYQLQDDAAAAEAMLKGVLENPKLDKSSAASLVALHDLGLLYATKLQQLDKAADALARVVEALDQQGAARLSPADQKTVLGGDEATAYRLYGDVFMQARRFEDAIKAYRRGLDYDRDDLALALRLGRALLAADRDAEALEVAERLVADGDGKPIPPDPRRVEAYDLLAQALTALGREDEILPRLERAVKANPNNAPLQYALAERYRKAGQLDKANAIFRGMLAGQGDPQGVAGLSATLLEAKKTDELLRLMAESASKPGGLEAIKPTMEAIATDPDYAAEVLDAGIKLLTAEPPALGKPARTILAYIATRAEKPEKLVELLRVVLEQDPSPLIYSELADAYMALERFDEAEATLTEMLKKYPGQRNPRLLVALGRIRARAGKEEAAEEAFLEARRLGLTDLADLYAVSVGLSSLGKADAAIETAREALKLDPASPDFNRLVGILLTQSGRDAEAEAHYKGLLEKFPNDSDVAKVAALGLSIIYVNRGEFDRGEAELERLLETHPDDPEVLNDLGYLYADLRKYLEKAESMIRRALEDEPENGAYLDSLGWVLFKRGKIKEAVEPLEKAAATPTGRVDPTVNDHLGDVYFRLQEFGKAQEAWTRAEKAAAEANPPDRRLPEIRKKLESLEAMGSDVRTFSGQKP